MTKVCLYTTIQALVPEPNKSLDVDVMRRSDVYYLLWMFQVYIEIRTKFLVTVYLFFETPL